MPRIPLPTATRTAEATAHSYPILIALQTQEFLQGALFYAAFADLAAGETVSRPGGVATVERRMAALGLSEGVSDQGWALIAKYKSVFEGVVFQSVLISLCSHWDWYVRRLMRFIAFSRRELAMSPLQKAVAKDLERADRLPIARQLEVIAKASGRDLQLTQGELDELLEMSLVRNLGLHNRWEADETYIERSLKPGIPLGDLRLVAVGELHHWHSLLMRLLHRSSLECAQAFKSAPEFAI